MLKVNKLPWSCPRLAFNSTLWGFRHITALPSQNSPTSVNTREHGLEGWGAGATHSLKRFGKLTNFPLEFRPYSYFFFLVGEKKTNTYDRLLVNKLYT